MNQTFIGIFPTKSRMLKNVNGTKWHIVKFTKFYILKNQIDYKTIIMSTKNNLIIVTSSANPNLLMIFS
jgi:hypothetical protein